MINTYPPITSCTSYIIAFIQSQNVAYASLRKLVNAILILPLFILLIIPMASRAQICGGLTPVFNVNLTGHPDSVWISPNVVRQDLCCTAASNETCVEFVVTLDPSSQGIIFNIYSGAMPSGALYYQLNCGPATAVGQPLCLTGTGPHYITFCKPGNNLNEYSITAIPQVGASGNITLNNGCSGSMVGYGYDPAGITWSSVYPGAPGAYNSFLDCTTCDSVNVFPTTGFPPYVDYQVCGYPLGGCSSTISCNIVRVYYNPTLTNSFYPPNPTVCYGSTGTTVTAVPSGGTPPYTFHWITGATTASAYLAPGTYTVMIGDTSSCPPIIDTIVVTGFSSAITANAGPDQSVCYYGHPVALDGSVTGTSTGIWSGGAGVFTPSSTALNATYTPTAAELSAGQVNLTLTTTNNGTCPAASDAMHIQFHEFQATVTATASTLNCYGDNNGSIALSVNGGPAPFLYSWNTSPVQYSSTATNLPAGNYTAVVTDANGCSDTINTTITQPALLTAAFTNVSNVSCYNGSNGTASIQVTGGVSPYIYNWNTSPAQYSPTATGLPAGTYSVTVTDAHGCAIGLSATITQPSPVITAAQGNATICPGQQTLISASGSGGNGNYSYNWQPALGNASSHFVSPPGTTTYSVTAVDNFGCAGNTETVTITVMTLTLQNVSVSAPVTICAGASTQIEASVTGVPGPVYYSWSPNIGNFSGPYTVNPATTATYTVTVTDNCANQVTATIPVTVNPLPLISIPPQSATGCDEVTFSFSDSSSANANAIHEWNFGDGSFSYLTNPVHSYTQSGNYLVTVTVTSAQGCVNYASAQYTTIVHASPITHFTSDATEVSIIDPTINFYDESINAVSWYWDFGDGNTSSMASPSHTYAAKGKYDVRLITFSSGGCTDTTSGEIKVNPETTLFVPSAFTPNSDGRNDILYAEGLEVTEFNMTIFDRWGEVIFTSNDMEKGWDGRAKGGRSVAQEGVYVYRIIYNNFEGLKQEMLGHVTLFK
jgi:gliding motility-associated-like protein